MAQETPLIVEVTDQAGAALPVNDITLIHAESRIPQMQKSAPAIFKIYAAGPASIEVNKSGHHTYQFDLEVKDTGGDFTVAFAIAKSMVDAPRMATLVKEGPAGSGRNRMRLEMPPAPREFLLVVGYDYPTNHSGGMAFEGLGTKRMHDLRGILTDSDVITLFDAKSGLRTRWVMGRGSEQLVAPRNFTWKSGWSRMTSDGTPPTILNPWVPGYPGPNVSGMPEVHRYIEEIGRLRPGSLHEFSILSHSYFAGPILFNTTESPPFCPGGATPDQRDPADRDGRFWKDFNQVNMPNRANFRDAFSDSPFVRVWGCLSAYRYRTLINTARRAASDNAPLGIPEYQRTSWFPPRVVFADNRLGVIQYFRESVLKSNYPHFLANAIGKPVWGAGPGMFSLFTLSNFGFTMFVNREDFVSPQGIINGQKPEMEFLESHLGSVFSYDGYLRYNP